MRRAIRSIWVAPRAPNPPSAQWWDWALVAVFSCASLAGGLLQSNVVWRPIAIVLSVGIAVSLLWRRTHPLAVTTAAFGSVVAVQLASIAFGSGAPIGLSAAAFALLIPYALFRWGSGREACIGTGLLLVVVGLGYGRDYQSLTDGALEFLILTVACVLGLAVRFLATSRTRELDQVRLGERTQLARDLHDTVAHHVSAMVIRAQAGQVVAAVDPAAALDALAVIEAEGSRTLAEMRAIVGTLRSGDSPEMLAPRSVADIELLARASGELPRVDVVISGHFGDLHPSVGAALYRIAQESVTNATRHAVDATEVNVFISRHGDNVTIEVTDNGAEVSTVRSELGYGLVGISERTKLLGGAFAAGPKPRGGWLVEVTLPASGIAR